MKKLVDKDQNQTLLKNVKPTILFRGIAVQSAYLKLTDLAKDNQNFPLSQS